MNLRRPSLPLTTQAAEGLPRRRWTVAEIEALTLAGVLDEDERFELIGGEIVPMQANGLRHEMLKNALVRYWARRLPDGFQMAVETTFRLDEDSFVEPDFVFYKTSDGLANLKPGTALLAVEVSDSSLAYDRGRKARIYAAFGIAEVWVIDAVTLETHQFRTPGPECYLTTTGVPASGVLAMTFAPELDVALGDLTLI